MNDRAPIRDRTLVLRILVPRLDQRLREKMKDLEESVANNKSGAGGSPSKTGGGGGADSFLELEGVSCEPTENRNRTLWNFRCDGVTYPAQLVNLPCPVEVHKTLDHASYYKSADIAQMLIVYEDHLSFDEAQEKPVEGFPSYYHSGLTPPMKRVVERRFERTFTSRDRKAVPPPRTAVQDVEDQLLTLMEKLQKDEKAAGGNAGSASNKRSNKLPVLTSATKDLVEIEEEVVEYEPWMDANGSQPYGIEFDAEDALAKIHPQVWLPAEQVQSIQEEMRRAEEEAAEKEAAKAAAAAAAAAPPKPKKKKKKAKAAAAAAEEPAGPRPKKGIPSRKNTTPVDELTQAAMAAMGGDDLMNDVLGSDDLFADLDLEFPGL